MHFPHGNQPGEEIFFFLRVRLMYDSFIAISGGTGFVGINPGNENQFFFYLVIESGKAVDILTDGIFVVCGAGTILCFV